MSNTMLFREASEPNEGVWGLPVEYQVFDDDEAADRLENGWFAHPHEVPGCAPEDVQPVRRGPGRPPKIKE